MGLFFSKLIENRLLHSDFEISKEDEEFFIINHLSKYIATNVLSWLNFEYDIKPKKVHDIIRKDKDAQAWLKPW